MNTSLENLKLVKDVLEARGIFFNIVGKDKKLIFALDFATKAHEKQYRKSGEPYIIHPILVSVIVKLIGGDDEMIIAALLHDTVEDTYITEEDIETNFGKEIKNLVDGLTKITEIREEELVSSTSDKKIISSALTFRKMLITSIEDVRVLVIKLCDRVHNMLTLDALTQKKQKRIAEETLVVYVPISHRLGISKIKNVLEDKCFYYLFPQKYQEITKYLENNAQDLRLKINTFIEKIRKMMLTNGFIDDSFKIEGRIKHKYSIYQKIQRKGVSIDEILDLLAIRILVNEPLDCYKVLGLIHLKYRPLISRFKDYIAIPKDNGYQTIHTTVFSKSKIYEIQIRTYDMHKSAEYGVASHWKYKGHEGLSPNLEWLQELRSDSDSKNIDQIIDVKKAGLYSEEVTVYSPKGDLFTLPRGATVLDFAFAVHSEVGYFASEAYINKKRVPFLTQLKNGDIVKIITGAQKQYRCSWITSVKTTRAKSAITQNCKSKLKELNTKIAKNILSSELGATHYLLQKAIHREKLEKNIYRAAIEINYLQTSLSKLKKSIIKNRVLFPMISPIKSYKLKEKQFDKLVIYSTNHYSNISFDYCCHPKNGDDIVGIVKGANITVHHKFCQKAKTLIDEKKKSVFIKWAEKKEQIFKLIISIENKKGALAKFLQYLAKIEVDLLNISLSKSEDNLTSYFEIDIEISKDTDANIVKDKLINKKSDSYNIIDFFAINDAYKN